MAAGSYTLIQRWVPLAADVGYLGDTFVNPRRRMPLELVDYSRLDAEAPSRSAISGSATHVAEAPQLPDGRKRVEFYPYSSTSESYAYVYWRSVGQLTYSDVLPPSVPSYILIEGALIDLFRYKMSQAMNASNGESAAFWRNEMRTHETKWNDHLVEVVKQFGATGRVLTLIAVLIGTGLMIAAQLVEASSFKIVLYGILAGLSAAGLYDFSRLFGSKSTGG